MKRDWAHAEAKKEREGHLCRVCERHGVESAHVTGRTHDTKPPLCWDDELHGRWEEPFQVHEDRIVPLCRACHNRYDDGDLDLQPFLRLSEQIQAVADAGSIELARMRISRPSYPSKLLTRHPEESVL